MIIRLVAMLVSTCMVSGGAVLIAADMVGTDLVAATFSDFTKPKPKQAELPPALIGVKDLTFFAEVPAKGGAFNIITGVKYAGSEDLLTDAEDSRWCYVMIAGDSVDRRVDLGWTKHGGTPDYANLNAVPASDLQELGVTRAELSGIARSNCRFEGKLS